MIELEGRIGGDMPATATWPFGRRERGRPVWPWRTAGTLARASRFARRPIRAGLCASGLLALAGCAAPLSVLDPAGPHAAAVARLWWAMLSGSVLLAGLVFVLLAAAFRRKRGGGPGERVWIGWLGLAMPGVVLASLLGYALVVGVETLPTPAADTVEVRVTVRRYAWDAVHPGGVRTLNVVHVPAGRPVDLVIGSEDVIHSLWVPRLAGKMDAIPGQTNRLRIIADRPGDYAGECAEYCGTGHRAHGFRVVAHDAAGWAAFIGGGR